ncbi:MAG: hypothetical protein LBO74_11870 [Candidatus Symbiothrix sp.]|jgi:hypothetical protein|nr:hypothetical protein [Candidatus Symbiothrix sp.]
MKVLFLPEIRGYFKELAKILYEKDYFGFEQNAIEYAEDLFNDIKESLPNKQCKKAPEYFNQYGENMYYATFKKNKNTQWHAFFNIMDDNGEIIYLVRYISNNHVIARYL